MSYIACRGYVECVEIPQCPIHHLITGAQCSPSGWQVLHDQIDNRASAGGYLCPRSRPCLATTPLVGYQIATRVFPGHTRPGHSSSSSTTSTPPIGDRAARLTNKTRADALLKLLAAQRNGWVNETAWAQRIREHLFAYRGRAPAPTPAHGPSLRAPLPLPTRVDF
jgi:hypothetical protein